MVDRLAEATGRERWEAFLALDDLLTTIGEDSPGGSRCRPPIRCVPGEIDATAPGGRC
ncbi:hypothetical protein [Kitasatospora aureofaciens]|uniref:hypothetical protein n=1 Tax=Kitasatospora aureofaciens TaxID=1894 RepID=UPI00325A6A9F